MKCLSFRFLALALFAVISSESARASPAATRVVHVFVALADNEHQGIIPVPSVLGDGRVPQRNLYWGASFGIKTFFKGSKEWQLIASQRPPKEAILERCIFKHREQDVFLVADAYEGSQIRGAVTDFLSAAAGLGEERLTVRDGPTESSITIGGGADLAVYIGHDAFMDFQIPPIVGTKGAKARSVIVLACASKSYFAPYLQKTGAEPLLWTTGLMAPEAYTLKSALDGWIAGEDEETIRKRAARAYDNYQRCGSRAALRLFATGW